MTTITCKQCGEVYDVDKLEEMNNLSEATAILCLECGGHLTDVNNGKVVV
jgi:Zn finger protein HypA/HybF involved in hydrogenase expression